jgi:hypothetical protein
MILVMLPLIDFIMFGNMDVLPFGGFGAVEAMSQVNSVVPVGLMVVSSIRPIRTTPCRAATTPNCGCPMCFVGSSSLQVGIFGPGIRARIG